MLAKWFIDPRGETELSAEEETYYRSRAVPGEEGFVSLRQSDFDELMRRLGQVRPWRITEEGHIGSALIADFLVARPEDEYRLILRFARKATNSDKFYLVGVSRSEWPDKPLETAARSCG